MPYVKSLQVAGENAVVFMEFKMRNIMIALLCASASLGTAEAATLSPSSAPVAVTPALGALVAGGTAGTAYINNGIDFSYGGVEGVFNGPPLAFGGVNGDGDLDLITAVDGRIVLEGTTNQGITSYFYAEAVYADIGSLSLKLFDVGRNLLATVLNNNTVGTDGRTSFSYSDFNIAFFEIAGNDTFGVNFIIVDTPSAAVPVPAAVPIPAAGLLLVAGLGMLAMMKRRRRTA